MSPTRRQGFQPGRPRSELYVAIAVGAGIVLGTSLLIWLMRPGSAGVPGGGGLLNRQPRMTLLVLLAAAVVGLVVSFVVRRKKPLRFGTRGSIAAGSGIAVVLAVLAGIFWPGGVIRHWPTLSNPTPVTTPAPTSTPTTKPATSTTKPSTSTTKPATSTTKPATTSTSGG